MTIDRLNAIGVALYGTQWQSDLARALNIDSRRIRQWLGNERPIPDWLDDELTKLLNDKIVLCQSLISPT